jgi:hypothetical protein
LSAGCGDRQAQRDASASSDLTDDLRASVMQRINMPCTIASPSTVLPEIWVRDWERDGSTRKKRSKTRGRSFGGNAYAGVADVDANGGVLIRGGQRHASSGRRMGDGARDQVAGRPTTTKRGNNED